jgi:hypothetical protein
LAIPRIAKSACHFPIWFCAMQLLPWTEQLISCSAV